MKKLLSILGALSITASTGALVVACGKDKEKNENSVFIDENGNLKIDSEKLLEWYQKNGGFVNDSNKYLKNIYNLFAVAVLQDAASDELISENNKNLYINEGLQDKLKNLLGNENSTDSSSLWGRANEKYTTLKNVTYKNDDKGLKKYLKGLFPNVKNDALEKAYKNNFILTDTDNSAWATLKRIVGFNSSYAVSSWENGIATERNEFSILFQNFKETFANYQVAGFNKKLAETVKTDTGAAKILAQLINASGGLEAVTNPEEFTTKIQNSTFDLSEIKFISATDAKELTESQITTLLNHMDPNFTNSGDGTIRQNPRYFQGTTISLAQITYANGQTPFRNTNNEEVRNYFEISVNIPKIINGIEQEITDSGVFGFLKNSQKFLIDNYYENKKPVALSEVVIPFKGSVADSTTISLKNFVPNKLDGSDETKSAVDRLAGIYSFYKNFVVSTTTKVDEATSTPGSLTLAQAGMTQWDTVMRGKTEDKGIIDKNALSENIENKWNADYYTAAKKAKLLTLDSSAEDFSNEYKYSVYDFINSENPQAKTIEATELDADKLAALLVENTIGSEDAKKVADAIVTEIPGESDKIKTRRKEAGTAISFLSNLLKEINQRVEEKSGDDETTTSEQKNYVVLNAEQGIIAFIDSNGLHFSRIDGYKLLNDKDIVQDQKGVSFKGNEENYLAETQSFKNLANLKETNSGQEALPYLINGSLLGESVSLKSRYSSNSNINKVEGEVENQTEGNELKDNFYGTYGIKNLANLNQSISNKYEKFLVNSSIATEYAKSSTVGAFYDFNIFDDVTKSLASESDTTLPLYASWMWDYFGEIMGDGKQSADLLSRYFEIPDFTTALKIKDAVSKMTINNFKAPADAYVLGMKKWNKTVIDAYKSLENSELNKEQLPFTPNSTILNTEDKTIALLSSNKFAPYKKTDSQATRSAIFLSNIGKQVEFQYSATIADDIRKAGN